MNDPRTLDKNREPITLFVLGFLWGVALGAVIAWAVM